MSYLVDFYQKAIAENDKNLRFWEEYVQNLKSIDFKVYSDKLKVPVLVPIGSRILFRGELKHTNEVTVALGADYFVKCSLQQAEVLKQHRIKNAESKLNAIRKERDYLENQVSFKQELLENKGHEIIEVHTEEEDKAWRQQHRDRMREWKQKGEDKSERDDIMDEELWNRLEELELQEELENELMKMDTQDNKELKDSSVIKEEDVEIRKNLDLESERKIETVVDTTEKVKFKDTETLRPTSKFELLQKVVEKQQELEEKLMELRNKDRVQSKTEADLIAKLDEMDALDELQDEMDMLEDVIETEEVDSDDETEDSSTTHTANTNRRVSFADDDDDETLELTFHHSDVEPSTESYDPKKGIVKPSDVYEAYSNSFTGETASILKKLSKYEDKDLNRDLSTVPAHSKIKKNDVNWSDEQDRIIVVKDVLEKVDVNYNKLECTEKRPVSLFKQRRQQNKI